MADEVNQGLVDSMLAATEPGRQVLADRADKFKKDAEKQSQASQQPTVPRDRTGKFQNHDQLNAAKAAAAREVGLAHLNPAVEGSNPETVNRMLAATPPGRQVLADRAKREKS
jgi:ribosomal protein L34